MLNISIHAPREGSDVADTVTTATTEQFQSTLPARGATELLLPLLQACVISIHAPREGSDEAQ